jgi:hypothetical protein
MSTTDAIARFSSGGDLGHGIASTAVLSVVPVSDRLINRRRRGVAGLRERLKLDEVDAWLTVVFLVGLFGFSVVSAVFDFETRWLTPALLLAVLLILRIVWPLGSLRSDIVLLQESVSRLTSDRELAKVQFHKSPGTFYAAATEAVREAKDRIYVTYLRQEPPDSDGEPYFRSILDWVNADPSHSVRRVIGRSKSSPAFDRWLVEQKEESAKSNGRYEIKLLDWPLEHDAINMALIDNEHVFLLVAGEHSGRLRGLSVDSPVASNYLVEYFNRLWAVAEDP